MNIDLINAELRTVAFMQQEQKNQLTYQNFVDIINAYHDEMMYSSHSYDNDDVFYDGVN
jgi:hypothetical protein